MNGPFALLDPLAVFKEFWSCYRTYTVGDGGSGRGRFCGLRPGGGYGLANKSLIIIARRVTGITL